MQLSGYITEEMLNNAATETAGLEALTQSINVQFEGASLDALKNFHAGLMAATLTIAKCESVDQLILSLKALQIAVEAKIEKLTIDSSGP